MVIPQELPSLSFEMQSLTGLELTMLDQLANESQGSPVSAFPQLKLQMCAPPCPGFCMGSGVQTLVVMLARQALY